MKPGRRCAPCGTTGPRSFFQLLAILGSFRSFTEGGAAAPSKPGRLPARFWQVSSIKPGNVAFLFSFSILFLIYASRHLLSRARAKYLFPPFPPLSVEGFPGAPGDYSDSPKSPKIVNVYLRSLGVLPLSVVPGPLVIESYPQVIHRLCTTWGVSESVGVYLVALQVHQLTLF